MLKQNLLNFDREAMRAYFVSLGEKPFRGDQVFQWIHYYGHDDFSTMTNLSQKLRAELEANVVLTMPKIIQERISKDGTCKWLLALEDNEVVETVFIPEKDRGTLCISSQVGCALGCQFCATGKLGFARNLTTAEIIGQVRLIRKLLLSKMPPQKITNVVFMGMGEPLLNLEAVVPACRILMDDLGYNLSKYRVTVSTVGIVPAMDELSKLTEASLALSLHAPTDEIRNKLIPMNQRYPIKEVIAACKRFFKSESKRKISIEYVMIEGVNDKPEHAKALIKLLEGVPCKVNLIPCNPDQSKQYRRSTDEAIFRFLDILMHAGVRTMMRRTRGADIEAACGQLAGQKR